PTFGADGALTGYDVRSGLVTVEGAGLNASNVDQVDLIARAVQANAAIYGNTLNVITGTNHVDHDTLATTPIAGIGAAPTRAIDVSQLGGMYANRIFLASNEYGVGVSNAGVLAAQAGDLTLTTQGRLVLSGRTNAGGNMTLSAAGGIDNSGTTYAQQNVAVNTAADLTNSGTLAAQQNTTVNAGSVASTGTLGAGINSDGTVSKTGDLTVSASGALSATGQNAAGGNAALSSASVNLAGSQTSANGNLALTATAGDMNLSGARTLAGGSLSANASGTLSNQAGTLAATGQTTVSALTLDNTSGTVSGNQLAVSATNLVNRGGTITQTGTAPTSISVSGTLDNTGGSLQTNSTDLSLAPATLINDHGTIADSGTGTLSVSTGSLSNNSGTLATNGALSVNAGAVSNEGGKLAAQSRAVLTVASLDNSAGGYVGATDVSVTDRGALNNSGGTVEASHGLTVSAGTLTNSGGSIRNAGTEATTVSSSGALSSTQGGLIGGNGDVSVTGGSVDNSGGSIVSGGSTTVQSGGTLGNAGGLVQGKGNVSVRTTGAITNTGGEIEANGAATSLQVSGSSLDNTNGRIANIGTGATGINAASITNGNAGGVAGAGMIGGNGDVTVSGQTLANAQGGQIVAGHDLALNVTQTVNNAGGTLSAARHLTLNQSRATLGNHGGSIHANGAIALNVASLDDTSGRIGNDTGSGGTVTITTAGALANQGGAIGSDQNLSITAGQLTGDGKIIAGNDGSVTVNGDYTNGAASQIQANHDLTFTTAGSFTNQGALAAVHALTVNAASVDNQAGAGLNSASTTVNATNAIANEGRLEGDTVSTTSATFGNTGTVVGNNVTLSAGTITNSGAAAAIAAASQLNLYAANSLSNTGGASVFSLGDINIAANGARDAGGLLANRTGSVTNDQSTIEAQGTLEIAAQTITNSRPAPTVQTVTTGMDTVHQTKRSKYIACATTNADGHSSCTQSVWNYGYKAERTDAFPASSIVSQDPSHNLIVLNVNGQQQTIYYSSMTTSGGTVTLTYWDAYNPNINYLPSTEYPTRSDAHNGYQRVEIARDTTTTTQQDQVVAQAPQAQLLSGGNMILANVGTINNSYSAIAAGGSIQIGSSQQGGTVGSGSYGGTQVNNTGQTLYQYQTQNIVSTYAWNEDITRDVGTVVETPVVLAPVAIGGTGGTIVANNAVQINATNVNNTNVAAANSATGAAGATLGANQASSGVSTTGRQAVGTANAPQTVAGSNGSLNIRLPVSGLYSFRSAPGQPYLVVTDPRLTSYTSFISSDYMLRQLGLNPQTTPKRLGDGLYEEQIVRGQITQLTGRVYLQGYTNNEDEYRALMASGVNAAKQFDLEPGIALTASQMDALTSDIVWLVNQTVTLPDGTTQTVLAPVVYLAHTHANDLLPTGALIAADDVEIHATGSAVNSGVIRGGTQTMVAATDILNRGGAIGSSGTAGTTVVSATNDVINASGQITGNRVAVLAGRDIINTTLVDGVGVSAASGDSKVNTTLLGAQGTIASTGDLMVSAGRDLTVHGAVISAGGDGQITAGRDITVDTVQSTTSQSVTKNSQHHWEADSTTHEGSAISSGGSLVMQSGNDTTFRGTAVSAGTDLAVVAGGNLSATTVTDTAKFNNVATDSKTRQEVDRTYDETAVGTTFSAGRNATVAAVNSEAGGNARTDGKGNVTLTGSSVTSGANAQTPGAATIAGNGNVTINEGREEHDSYTAVQSKRGSFVNGSTTNTMQASQSNVGVASTVSGDTVQVQSGRDLTVQGSNVVGTNDVKLGAVGNVNITTSQDTYSAQSDYQKREYGFLSGLNPLNQLDGGLQGYTVGVRKTTDAQQATQVTNTGSMVGSVNGNLTVTSGNDVHVTGSTIHAGNDLNVAGRSVTIDAARDTATQNEQQSFSQTAISAGISSPVLAAVQTGVQMAKDVKHTKGDARLDALAAATTGLAAKNGYDAVMSDPTHAGGIGISVSLGTSHSNSNSTAASSTAVGSTVSAGRDVNIAAAGAGAGSNIDVIGSSISAGRNAALNAEGNIDLQAAQNTTSQHSTNSGSNASVGVTFGFGQQNGISFQLGVSGTKGHADGTDSTWTNTHLDAGNALTLKSGGDTNLKGAVASGQQVIADVGGNLNIQSLQDVTHYDAKQQSGGVSVSVCVPPICYGSSSVAANFSQNRTNSDFASVTEQSGIKAGDGGFQVDVKGNTDLKGAVIASSDKAVQDGLNSLTTATLTHSDIANHAEYSAQQVGIGGGYSFGGSTKPDSGVGKDQKGTATNVNPINGTQQPTYKGFSATPPVALSASGDASSTTKSGISGGTLTITDSAQQQQLTGQTAAEAVASINRDTSNAGGTLAPIFDKDKIQTGFDITSQFINQAGTFVDNRMKESAAAQKALDAEKAKPADEQNTARIEQLTQTLQDNATWEMGGTGRMVLTAIMGAAAGNVTGSTGAMIQSAAAYYLQSLATQEVKGIADMLDNEAARAALQGLVACAGAAAQSKSCGAGAAGAAASVVLNNLLDGLNGEQASTLSADQKQARENIVASIVAGATSAVGGNAAAATVAALIETENNAASFVKGTTERVKTASTTVGDILRKPRGAITRKDIDAALAALSDVTSSGNLSNQESLNVTSLWMAVVERAAAENLMTPQEIVGSRQFMLATIGSMAFSGGGNSSVRAGGSGSGPELPGTTGSRGATNAAAGTANSVSGARLGMQLSAEEAAGTRAPTLISSYSDHAQQQIAGRDGGIGVSQAAVDDAFANPTVIQYVPSKYGPTFKYVGQNATVVVNPQGNVVTAWGTSAAGVGK
ncbi:hemagglutinin repeat-containing protein, partial [Paraburkholderia kururiensis]|uniref:hemagglutinin repeat-containing protein n=1 Tax=Paraburkholderia kururiensis TaxID=984307 RepID=UPI0018F47B59